jgi:PAS domain S-box-containing protein
MTLLSKIALFFASILMLVFFVVKTLVLISHIDSSPTTRLIEYICFMLFIPLFGMILKDTYGRTKREKEKKEKEVEELNAFIDAAVIVSKADTKGRITYVNRKFTKLSGWSIKETLGKDHRLVNSGKHPKKMWVEMYHETVKNKKIWNRIVTNRSKDGSLYYVDTYIKADFDDHGRHLGFTSIRQDVTDLKLKEQEVRNQLNAINQSNAVIQFDLSGKILSVNQLFLSIMGYSDPSEVIGLHHHMFIGADDRSQVGYVKLWESLSSGKFISGEFQRVKQDGSRVWLQATYNPILGIDGKPHSIMKIATDITQKVEQLDEINKKNTYLEHAAKILRHDMHSGINTYIPRGISSLERRLSEDDVKNLKLEAPLKMLKEGLKHTQKVYKGVYEFTNLVKQDSILTLASCNIKTILDEYLSSTSYKSQVILDDSLPELEVNESLFCTAVDNLIRNGLKYNDSATKMVKIYYLSNIDSIAIEDNGRGLDQQEFDRLSKPYARKEGQRESGSGLGLNICTAILKEHGFEITAEKLQQGTRLKIKLNQK